MLYRIIRCFKWISILIFIIGMIFDFVLPIQPIPLIEKKEFAVVFEYEIDGKKTTDSDKLICEFVGYNLYSKDMQFTRRWTSYLKSGRDKIVLLKNEDIEIFYSYDSANVYGAVCMGDTKLYSKVNNIFPNARYITTDNSNPYIISAEEMANKYNIKLLNCTIDPPIKNIFLNIKVLLIGQLCFIFVIYYFVRKKTV